MSGMTTRQHAIGDLLLRSAARYPAKTAVVYGELRQSYADLDRTVNRTANALAARGVRKGDRFADRKSTRLNSSHVKISYAVFCLKKKKIRHPTRAYTASDM